ncbi:MAG: YceD family protein [Christensenellaceae bacterium]
MIIDVKRCLSHRQYNGEISLEIPVTKEMIGIPYVEAEGPAAVKGTFHILEDDSLEIEAELTYTLFGCCSRCLKETRMQVKYSIHEYFVKEDNGEDYLLRNNLADLTEVIGDAILTSMPLQVLCPEGCEMIAYHS